MRKEYENLSVKELMTVTNNIKNIEHFLGHEMPTNLINIDDLRDHNLQGAELTKMVEDIKRIESTRRNDNPVETAFAFIFAGIVILFLLGIDVLGWIDSLL